MVDSTNNQIRELKPEEGLQLVDKLARQYFDMSAQEFEAAWEAGQFDGDPDNYEVMHVVMLLPFVKNGRKNPA